MVQSNEDHLEDRPLEKAISRRGFLSGAALVGAAAALGLAGCQPSNSGGGSTGGGSGDSTGGGGSDTTGGNPAWLGEEPQIADADIKETVETEILIIGAGTGGMFAACAAGEDGAKVLVLDRGQGGVIRDDLGGVNSRLQQENNYTIDKRAFMQDMYRYASGHQKPRLLQKWFDNSGEVIDWYEKVLKDAGVKLWHEDDKKKTEPNYPHWATGHSPQWPQDGSLNGLKVLTNYADNTGNVEIRWSTPMVKLVVENNKVTGASAKNDAGYIKIKASKGTIVSTGGYALNDEMMKALQPHTIPLFGMNVGFPGNQGDGIKACLWAGASWDDIHTSMLFDRSGMKPDSTGGPDDMTGQLFWMGSQPWLKVNLNGERFCNESGTYDFVLHASAHQPNAIYVTLFDDDYQKYAEQFDMHGCSRMFPFDNGAPQNIPMAAVVGMNQGLIDQGYLQKADTIEELAGKLGIPADKLKATVDRNNQNYDAGADPDFGKEPYRLSPVRKAPFYGIRQTGMILSTMDGITINEDCQALRADGSVIDGLYVIGNDSGGYYANTYPNLSTGNACGRTITFARMTAKALAKA